jgi:hypothetical protein
MNEDVLRTIREMEAGQTAGSRARTDFAQAWRRLKAYRDGLAVEVAGRSSAEMCEDPDALFEGMMESLRSRAAASEREAAAAEAGLASHESNGGFLARMGQGWRARRAALAEDAASKRSASASLAAGLSSREDALWRRAVEKARENRAANVRAAKPWEPLRRRLAGIDLAISALDAGDTQVVACLQRWDLDAMVTVAGLWRKLRDYGRLSEVDYSFYLSAGRQAPPTDREFADQARQQPVGEEGEAVRMAVGPDGTIIGTMKRAYGGAAEGTNLASLGVVQMAELLGSLKLDGLGFDADLLEAFMDAGMPDWRDAVAAAVSGPASAAPPVGDDSAFDVFGVTPQTPTSEIAAIFQRMMQAENAPERRLIAAFKTIKALRAGDGNPAVPG